MSRRNVVAFAIAFVVVTVVMMLAGIGLGVTLEQLALADGGPDSVEVVLGDSVGEGPDAIASVAVLSTSRTVEDSTIACAVYVTADKRVGLMAPAFVVRRVDRSTVQPSYDRDVVTRCAPLLKANGLTITSRTVHPVVAWRLRTKARRAQTIRV